MKLSARTLLLLPLLALGACDRPPAGQIVADVATIRTTAAEWDRRYNGGDVDGVAALYAPDAVLMPPGAPAARGSAAIHDVLAASIAESKTAGLVIAIGAEGVAGANGDRGYRSGTFELKDRAGATVETGKYIELWRKVNGRWLIERDIWNTDSKPAPAPSAQSTAN